MSVINSSFVPRYLVFTEKRDGGITMESSSLEAAMAIRKAWKTATSDVVDIWATPVQANNKESVLCK